MRDSKNDLAEERASAEHLAQVQAELEAATAALRDEKAAVTEQAEELRGQNASLQSEKAAISEQAADLRVQNAMLDAQVCLLAVHLPGAQLLQHFHQQLKQARQAMHAEQQLLQNP